MFVFLRCVGLSSAFAEEPSAPPPQAADPVTYRLDPVQSYVYAVVYNDPGAMAARLGHDHVLRPRTFEGTVVWDLDDPAACRVDLSFPVTALWPDPPGMREREALNPAGAVGEDSKATIVGNLQSKNQLDAARFPTISFRATSCSGTTGAIAVTGDLSIRGVAKPVTAEMRVEAAPTSFAAGGVLRIKHSDFGFSPFTNLAGALRNLDEIKLVIDVKGAP